jgi:hypothetical protein
MILCVFTIIAQINDFISLHDFIAKVVDYNVFMYKSMIL